MDISNSAISITIREFSPDSTKIKQFRRAVLRYWDNFGRKNLPWRKTTDPWKILVAEVLLRKTTSRQVSEVYEELINLSPKQVCEIHITKLAKMLRPLGIYNVRSRQLKLLAQTVVKADPNNFEREDFLKKLPGVGRYALNTILCFAYNRPRPALDTNMIRVVCRYFGLVPNRSRPREDKKLWEFAEKLVPKKRCREFNWGVLDFANAVCIPRNPDCPSCSLTSACCFYSCEEREKGDKVLQNRA